MSPLPVITRPYLSHLLLPVVHGLTVLGAAGRWTLAQPAQTQAAPLLLLLVQNLVLGENEFRVAGSVSGWSCSNKLKGNCLRSFSLKRGLERATHQPSSGDDQCVLARLGEERQLGSLASDAALLRFVSPAGLTGAELATGDKHMTGCDIILQHPDQCCLVIYYKSNPLL